MQRVYYVNEQNGYELNALTKARQDVRYILDEIGWNEKLIHRKIESQNKIIHYFRMGFWTVWDWTHLLNNLEEHAILLIQFPMINSLIFNEIAAKLISKEKEKKYLKVILLIHDIDSIRFPDQEMKQKKHELAFWNIADVFIAHNTEMKKYLQDLGIEKPIIELGIFDYIVGKQREKNKEFPLDQIVIAGNLDSNKARYLLNLKDIRGIQFNLYGPCFTEESNGINIKYKGVYSPDVLPEKIEGSWGLVWDGDSIFSCEGGYGNYLRYNDPHKLSFYMAIGMPVIIWEDAAAAKFVQNMRVGITVKNLKEVPDKIAEISSSEYKNIQDNVEKISYKVRNGIFLKQAIKKCLHLL